MDMEQIPQSVQTVIFHRSILSSANLTVCKIAVTFESIRLRGIEGGYVLLHMLSGTVSYDGNNIPAGKNAQV